MSSTNGQGDALKLALDSMPDVMGSLMREFILKKDITSRIQIRLRMKALLDFAGVDTEYPSNPLKKEAGPETARDAALRDGQAAGLLMAAPPDQNTYTGLGMAPVPPDAFATPVLPRVGIDNGNFVR